MTGLKPLADKSESEIYLTLHRVIDAPVEEVYAAWTESEMLRHWMAPGNASVVRAVTEVVVGGTFLVEILGEDGRRWVTCGTYLEVVPFRRLVHTWRWEGSEVETLVTVEFKQAPRGTRLTLTHSRFAKAEARDEHVAGWNKCLTKLKDLWYK